MHNSIYKFNKMSVSNFNWKLKINEAWIPIQMAVFNDLNHKKINYDKRCNFTRKMNKYMKIMKLNISKNNM